jgi:hypothetical protein
MQFKSWHTIRDTKQPRELSLYDSLTMDASIVFINPRGEYKGT